MMELTVREEKEVSVKYLKVKAGVRYWEDGSVNGVPDDDGLLIPARAGDCWCPIIDLETGVIEGWPAGETAKIHYKVCDDGVYTLLDGDHNAVATIEGYVPGMMAPGGNGYGDYIIMNIGGDGKIANWRADLSEFES